MSDLISASTGERNGERDVCGRRHRHRLRHDAGQPVGGRLSDERGRRPGLPARCHLGDCLMASPNLNITHVAAAQNQKEVTINDAIDALDRAMGNVLVVDFTAGNVTLTDAQFRGAVAFVAANLSVTRDLTVPQIKRLFAVSNAAGTAALTIKRGTGAVEVAAGTAILAYTDGTANGLVALSA